MGYIPPWEVEFDVEYKPFYEKIRNSAYHLLPSKENFNKFKGFPEGRISVRNVNIGRFYSMVRAGGDIYQRHSWLIPAVNERPSDFKGFGNFVDQFYSSWTIHATYNKSVIHEYWKYGLVAIDLDEVLKSGSIAEKHYSTFMPVGQNINCFSELKIDEEIPLDFAFDVATVPKGTIGGMTGFWAWRKVRKDMGLEKNEKWKWAHYKVFEQFALGLFDILSQRRKFKLKGN